MKVCHDLSGAKLEFDLLASLAETNSGRPSKMPQERENDVAREFSGYPMRFTYSLCLSMRSEPSISPTDRMAQ